MYVMGNVRALKRLMLVEHASHCDRQQIKGHHQVANELS
jgi:hypothetical protein